MSDFNPDEYLAKTESEFDPDKYLSSTPTTVEQPLAAGDITAVQGLMSTARPVTQAYWEGPAKGVGRDAYSMANILKNVDPETAKKLASQPLEFAKAFVQGHPWYGAAKDMPGRALGYAGRSLGGVVAAPENLFTLPYSLAAYEQEQIRQNPNAPGLESNPFAQTVRGEASTQGRAGAANQMRTVANMPYGNVTPAERQLLEQDAMMKQAIRKKAFEKVMGPVVPGSF